MNLHNLTKPEGLKKKKIVGRGSGSGMGKTSTRGHKGQTSRAGGRVRRGFEGGQMPLSRRLPKRGFHNIFAKTIAEVNLRYLEGCAEGSVVDPLVLMEMGLCKGNEAAIKIIGRADIKHPITVRAHKFSKGAKESIEKNGGKAEEIVVN